MLCSPSVKEALDRKTTMIRHKTEPKYSIGQVCRQMRDIFQNFVEGHSGHLQGRVSILNKLEEMLLSGEKDTPVLLLGGAGCGKTSIMAKVTDVLMKKAATNQLPGGTTNGWSIFYHFVGAAARSSELAWMLRRLCCHLELVNESAMPYDLTSLAQLCCHALSSQNTKPLIVIIDAVNQFDGENSVMSWVPRKLGPNVRCVFSMVNDSPQHLALQTRENKPQELHMTPLDMKSRRCIVEQLTKKMGYSLSNRQTGDLLSKQTSENPLWLTVALEQIGHMHGNRGDVTRYIEQLPTGLLNLLMKVLEDFEKQESGYLLTSALCLIEASATGLTSDELINLLGDEDSLKPASPFEEKEEKECSEKEEKKILEKKLSVSKWKWVYKTLQAFLQPANPGRGDHINFNHKALSRAVQKRFFCSEDDLNGDGSTTSCLFWHKRLVNLFESHSNINRKVEEYLYQLCKIEDYERLSSCLCDWEVFDRLYSEEHSFKLLSYWQKVGETSEMVSSYKSALQELEEKSARDEQLVSKRHQHVARIFLQAGCYGDALTLTKVAMKLEERELGNRPEEMVEIYSLMAEIYDERLKLNDFVSPTQLPDLRKTISYGRKSIDLRKTLQGDYHKFKLGLSLMKLAFSLESWKACGGDEVLSGDDALQEGNLHIDAALVIFKELKDDGQYAEALMTKGVLAPRGSMEQLKYYNEALEICMQVYGEESLLTFRLYINIGIVYEDNKDYVKAYDFFTKWAAVSEKVLGPDHPKTKRAKGVLKEPKYQLVAQYIGQLRETENRLEPGSESSPESINQGVDNMISEQVLENFDEDDLASSFPIFNLLQRNILQQLQCLSLTPDEIESLDPNDLQTFYENVNELLPYISLNGNSSENELRDANNPELHDFGSEDSEDV